MFDSQYNTGMGMALGCGCSSPQGLGSFWSCTGERAERERRHHHREHLRNNAIPQARQALVALENGPQQKLYVQLNDRLNKLNVDISRLKAEKMQAMRIRDSWRENPEVAAASGLGLFSFIGKTINNAVSCERYVDDIKNINAEIAPLEGELGQINGRLESARERLSAQNMRRIQEAVKGLETEKKQLQAEITSYKAEIEDMKNARNLRIETERLALEQEQKRREQEAQEKARREQEAKNMTTWLYIFGAAVGGWMLLKGNKTVVKVKK